MFIPDARGNNCAQYDFGKSYIGTDNTPSSESVVTDSTSTNSSSTFPTSPQDVCDRNIYICNFEKISENYNDVSLQGYSVRCGYKLTEDFLSVVDKCRTDFIGKIDSILVSLSSSFCFFLEGLKGNNKDLGHLMDKTCSSFSKGVYDLRPKCIKVLQYNIIPIIIKNIFDSSVVDGSSERKMTCPEMEKLFIHLVTSLEKLIMVKMMNYWQDFCNKNNILSLISDIDYSNPFIRAHNFDGISIPRIACPAAFTKKFGEFISFIAIAKIDEMVAYFIDKSILYKFCTIFSSDGNGYNDIKRLRDKFRFLVKEEFDKKIIEERINDKFRNFLNTIVMCYKHYGIEINMVLIFDNIIEYMKNSLVNTINSNLHDIFIFFKKGNSLGVYIHPEDNCKILSIMKNFSDRYRRAVKDKFCAMLLDKYEFSDGTVIGMFCWNKVSKNILPIIQEAIKHLVDAEHKALHGVLSGARVVEDIGVFDGYFAGTRKATSEEIDSVLKKFIDVINSKNGKLFIKIWAKLVADKKGDISKGLDSATDHKLLHLTDGGDSSVVTPSVKRKLPVDVTMPVFVCGLNLHHDDYNLILTVRKKFSIKIRNHINELFYSVHIRKDVLPSGRVMNDYSWDTISSDLSEVAMASLKFINEEQYKELDRVLSKARIVDVNGDFSYCIREITDNEKKDFMAYTRKLVDESLTTYVKKSLSIVFSKYFIKYGYEEKYQDVASENPVEESVEMYAETSAEAVEGRWGVKLRYSDNVAILRVRKKFSSRIKGIVYTKFSDMLYGDDRFYDCNYVGIFSWLRLSKKLVPIARDEASTLIKEEREELEEIVSKARVMVDSKVDRELTDEEKSNVLEKIMNFVDKALIALSRRIWKDVIRDSVITTLKGDSISDIDCVGRFSPSLVNGAGSMEFDEFDKVDISKVKLCCEDDMIISNIRRKFSFDIYSFVSNRFTEMIDKKYKFDDDTVMCLYSWRKVSKKIVPIIKKEINPILENERLKISEALLESRVVVSSPDASGATVATREITSGESSYVLKKIMESIYKNLVSNYPKIWNKIIKLPLSLLDINEVDKLEINNIRLEFVGSLGLVVSEVIDSLLPDIDASSFSLECVSFNLRSVVYERSRNFFKEGGFLSRVESLLSSVKVNSSGDDRFITDKEKKSILRKFMGQIDSDRDDLVRKRISEKLNTIFFSEVNFSSHSHNKRRRL